MAAATPPPPTHQTRRLWPLLLALPLLLAGGVAALLWWSVRSEAGSAWLAAQVPGLRVTGAKGTLLGDFSAQRIEIALPRDGAVRLDDASWQGLRIEWIRGRRPRIVIERLAANRVEIRPGTAAPQPEPPPTSLALPVELVVEALQVQTLQSSALGDTPVRDLRAQVHLGAESGGQHRIDGLSLAFGALRAQGAATLGSAAPLPLQARLQLTQEAASDNTQWSANAMLAGPLAAPQLQATLRARPAPGPKGQAGAAQSLDLSAQLRPFERWPLGALDAHAQGLDLSALHPDAPVTSLTGRALAQTTALDQPAVVSLQLQNAVPGLWNEGRLPLQRATLELRARPDDPSRLDLQALDAELGTAKEPGGRVQGGGRWSREGWNLDATLAALQPSRLDARAPKMQLAGPVRLQGSAPDARVQTLELRAELNGQLADRGPARSVHLKLDAGARRVDGADRIELREALAAAGGARASFTGTAARASADADWSLKAHAQLAEFDPAPWWPGREDSAWRRGPHKLNANGELDLTLPHAAAVTGSGTGTAKSTPTTLQRLAALRGQATLKLNDSLLAGVSLRGEASLRSSTAGMVEATLNAESDTNKLRGEGRIASRGDGAADSWTLSLDAPALVRLAPIWRLASPAGTAAALAGTLNLEAKLNGRWPQLATSGQLQASGLRVDTAGVQRGSARWQAGTTLDAPAQAQVELAGVALGAATFETAQLQLQGNGRAHRLELRAASKTRPPAWTDSLQGETMAAKADATPPLSTVLLQAQGGLVSAAGGALSGWRGKVEKLELGSAAGKVPWVRSEAIGIELLGLETAPLRATLQPGRAEVLGAALRWSKVAWQAAQAGAPAQIEAQAELEPLAIAPLLARLQPDFGWGGDLLVSGHLDVRSAPSFAADIVLERSRGDLTVTDEVGTQALGLTDLRLGLNAADGTWSFTQGLAGSTLGVAAGAFVARTTPQATWPAADAPVSGVLQLEVANLGTWGTWVPPGWRLGGALKVSAGIGGRFGAPEYTGQMEGHALSVRNFLQGVNVSDGEVAIALQGASARIERFTARAGTGTVTLAGNATLGSTPQALLKLTAQKFQLLGRVDRRIVASGEAQLQLERDKLALDGRFSVDEGLIDFTRSDAPSLADDVTVVRAHAETAHRAGDEAAGAPVLALPKAALDLRVDMGSQLRLRGRGLDTGLRGELRITSPGGRLAVNGTVRAIDGTYAAYGQKLEIDRGDLTFNGPAENPRLDIEATRPNLDVRVGVAVTGTAVNPRVRLFSEPELSEIDKLSWLVLGRASDGLGRTDTALLQRAALALLAGDGEGPTDQITRAIGLDEVSLHQTEGDVRETVISLGKQLSRRWYVGYERSLNATTGSWQLIYRIAQRFTLRAQSGEDSSLDLIWTWRWH